MSREKRDHATYFRVLVLCMLLSRNRCTLSGDMHWPAHQAFGVVARRSSAVLRMISAISGLLLDSIWKSTECSDRRETAVAALTVAVRGSPLISAISPKKLPAPSSTGFGVATLTRPSTMKNI